MITSLRTKLRSFASSHPLRSIRSFSSIDDVGRSPYPPEPIPNRPLRGNPVTNHRVVTNTEPPRSPRFSKPNRARESVNQNSFRAETDADFLERFKLGFDRVPENTKTSTEHKAVQPEKAENVEPLSAPEDAEEIFRKMKETGLIPNAVSMLDGLCKDGRVQEAMKLFGSMREKGSIPKVVVYTAVVEGFCKAHKLDDAIRIFKKMQANDVIPNAYTYQVLIRGLCRGKKLDEAFGFTIEMLEAGNSPNLATFTGLVDGYCKEKGLEQAKTVIGEMKQKGYFFEEKAAREYLDKNGPFIPLVWEAILGRKDYSRTKLRAEVQSTLTDHAGGCCSTYKVSMIISKTCRTIALLKHSVVKATGSLSNKNLTNCCLLSSGCVGCCV